MSAAVRRKERAVIAAAIRWATTYCNLPLSEQSWRTDDLYEAVVALRAARCQSRAVRTKRKAGPDA